jgi:hypothetical protein
MVEAPKRQRSIGTFHIVVKAGAYLVGGEALVPVIADNDHGERLCAPAFACLARPDQVLAKGCAGRRKAVDARLRRESLGETAMQSLGIGHHRRLDIGVAHDRTERPSISHVVVLIVDVAGVVDAYAVDDGEKFQSRDQVVCRFGVKWKTGSFSFTATAINPPFTGKKRSPISASASGMSTPKRMEMIAKIIRVSNGARS